MNDLERYSRQTRFQPIGEIGQRKLLNSRAAVVGVGALGTTIANHLVRSGVGYIKLIDRDFVELSNLHRQSLYTEEDAKLTLPKAAAAHKILQKINSSVTTEAFITDLNLDNAEELLSDVDVILDGTDNFMTRYLINDVAVKYHIPWIYGGAVSASGMLAVIKPGITPCFRCLFPHVPSGLGETCDTVGVVSPLTDVIGSLQAMEAIKILAGAETNPNLVQWDIWNNTFTEINISKGRNPNCPACGNHQFEFLDRSSYQQAIYTALCGRDTVQINFRNNKNFNLEQLAESLKKIGKVTVNEFLLRFSPDEKTSIVIFKNSRVLVHGTNDITKARSIYAKYFGG